MKARCGIEVAFPDSAAAKAALAALSHEADVGGRSATRMGRNDCTLTLDIKAGDIVALRAAANACLRALQAFEGIEEEGVKK